MPRSRSKSSSALPPGFDPTRVLAAAEVKRVAAPASPVRHSGTSPPARMPRSRNGSSSSKNGNGSSASLGFEAQLWLAADKLRSNMDAAEYKHVVLGLIFLKYISDKD